MEFTYLHNISHPPSNCGELLLLVVLLKLDWGKSERTLFIYFLLLMLSLFCPITSTSRGCPLSLPLSHPHTLSTLRSTIKPQCDIIFMCPIRWTVSQTQRHFSHMHLTLLLHVLITRKCFTFLNVSAIAAWPHTPTTRGDISTERQRNQTKQTFSFIVLGQ